VAKEYVCNKLALIGSAQSVGALAELLANQQVGHAARAALEVMPCIEAGDALRDQLPNVPELARAGIINSLGARPNPENVSTLAALLPGPDAQVAAAAAAALGEIGTTAADNALSKFEANAPEAIRQAIADARLACAERLLSAGRKAEALAIYKALSAPQYSKHVQLAAKRGQLRFLQQK
jgi:hypothetical protein